MGYILRDACRLRTVLASLMSDPSSLTGWGTASWETSLQQSKLLMCYSHYLCFCEAVYVWYMLPLGHPSHWRAVRAAVLKLNLTVTVGARPGVYGMVAYTWTSAFECDTVHPLPPPPPPSSFYLYGIVKYITKMGERCVGLYRFFSWVSTLPATVII